MGYSWKEGGDDETTDHMATKILNPKSGLEFRARTHWESPIRVNLIPMQSGLTGEHEVRFVPDVGRGLSCVILKGLIHL